LHHRFGCRGQSAPDGIFLNPVEGAPKIIAVIIAAVGLQR
jgi:hypothetical protein